MKSLLTVMVFFGFFLFVTPAAADVGCPGDWIECYESTNPCIIDVYGCDLDRDGDCDTYSPDYRAPGSNCTTEGGADGKCDGTGECTEVPMADHTTCEGANVVYEPDSGLCLTFLSAGTLSYDGAENYCADAYDDGYFDWRLPTIDELRALINTDPSTGGCEDDPINGSCQVSDPDCLDSTTCMDGCDSCDWLQTGYVVPGIPDLGSQFWSSSADTSAPGMQWTVNFREAKVATYDTSDYWGLKTRCVRVPVTGTGGGPQQDIISDSTAPDSWNQHVFNVEPGSQFSVNFETHSGAAFYFVQWDQPGGFGGNQCYKHVTAGQTDSCDNLTVDAGASQAYVSVQGMQFGVDYTITVDYVSSGSTACADTDGDTVCDADDVCPGYDDLNDQDGNGSPDHCDCVKYDIVGTTTWGGNPAFEFGPDGQVSYTYSTSGGWYWYEDDTYACYNVYLDPSNYVDFPRCDFDQDGVVTLAEVYEVHDFATFAGNPIGGGYSIATCSQIL